MHSEDYTYTPLGGGGVVSLSDANDKILFKRVTQHGKGPIILRSSALFINPDGRYRLTPSVCKERGLSLLGTPVLTGGVLKS